MINGLIVQYITRIRRRQSITIQKMNNQSIDTHTGMRFDGKDRFTITLLIESHGQHYRLLIAHY